MRIDEYLLMQREIVLHFILRQQTGLSRLGNEFPPAPSAFSRFSPFAFQRQVRSTPPLLPIQEHATPVRFTP